MLFRNVADLAQVVGEACGDRTPEIHNANLFDLNAKYADVVTEAEALQQILATRLS